MKKLNTIAKAACASIAIWTAASAMAADLTIDFANTRGAGTATDKVLIENIRVLVPVINPFNPSASTTVETTYNVTFKFDPTTLHLVPESISQTGGTGANNCATAQVQVYNALQGQAGPISGATVTSGGQTATTNAQGVATLSNLPQGAASFSATATGYTAATQTALLSCTAPGTVTMALSPAQGTDGGLTSGQFRVILTWGQNPSDLDSHMTGPSTSTSRWHVYYAAKTAGDMCGLDVDDTSSFGPETVTCPRTNTTGTTLRDGVYRYSVHHFSGSSNIGASGASVRLEFANGRVYTYTPPASATYVSYNDVWTVFELTVASGSISVAPVNTVTRVTGASSVLRSAPVYGDFGQAEDPEMFLMQSK